MPSAGASIEQPPLPVTRSMTHAAHALVMLSNMPARAKIVVVNKNVGKVYNAPQAT